MKKILFSLFLFLMPCLYAMQPEDYENLKIDFIKVTSNDDAYILIKNDRKNVFYFYEIDLDNFLSRYDHAVFSLYEIDVGKFVQIFEYLSLEKAQKLLPGYHFTEENYGL